MKYINNQSNIDALVQFWIKIKYNFFYDRIRTLLNYDISNEDRQKRTLEVYDAIQHALLNYFVRQYIDLSQLDRLKLFFGTCLIQEVFFFFLMRMLA